MATAIASWSIWRTVSSPQTRLFGSEWFQETLHRFRFTQQEWLPSSWLTDGLLEAARPDARGRVAHERVSRAVLPELPVPGAVDFQRDDVPRADGVGGQTLVSRRLHRLSLRARRARHSDKSRDRSRDRALADVAGRMPAKLASWSDRCGDDPARPFPAQLRLLLDEGLAAAAPRSGAVVAVPDLLRPVGPVFSQRRPLQQSPARHQLRHLDQHGQLSESGRRRADSLDVHDAVHLSDDQPGRPLLLDSGPAADRARHDSVEQVLCSRRSARGFPARR